MVCSGGKGGHLLRYLLWEGQVSALPPSPAPTPSVALFPTSSTATPIFFHSSSPRPPPRPYPSPKTHLPLLSSRSRVRNPASGGPRCGSEDGPRCGKGRTPSFLHLPFPPSPAADPSPSSGTGYLLPGPWPPPLRVARSAASRQGGRAAAGSVLGAGTRT